MKESIRGITRHRILAALLLVVLFQVLAPAAAHAGDEEFSRALVLLEKGEKHLDKSSLDMAERILVRECDRPKRDMRCEYYLARLYLAEYSYWSRVKSDPVRSAEALSKAEAAGREAVARFPDDPDAHVIMGRIHQVKLTRYFVSGLTQAALAESPVVSEYKKALELDPGNGEAEMGLGIYYQFIPRVLGGDGHRARNHFKRAALLMPENPEPLVWLSISYREEGKLDKARAALDRALEIDSRSRFVQAEARRLEAAEKAYGSQ